MGAGRQANAIFDPYAERIIRDRARRVARQASLPSFEREDLEQDLRVHLWKQRGKFDPTRGCWTTFARCVVERKAAALLGAYRAASTGSRLTTAEDLDSFDQDTYRQRVRPGAAPAHVQNEMQIDVARKLSQLAPTDRALARLLMHERITDIARLTGIARGTLYGRIARLRAKLDDGGLRRWVENPPTNRRHNQ